MHEVIRIREEVEKMGEQRKSEEAGMHNSALPKQATGRKRMPVKIRLHPDTKQRAEYWAERRKLPSANEYIAEAVEEKIARENQDYDLPTLESMRQTQIVDELKALAINVANLEHIFNDFIDSIMRLTRGDNYLSDSEIDDLHRGEEEPE